MSFSNRNGHCIIWCCDFPSLRVFFTESRTVVGSSDGQASQMLLDFVKALRNYYNFGMVRFIRDVSSFLMIRQIAIRDCSLQLPFWLYFWPYSLHYSLLQLFRYIYARRMYLSILREIQINRCTGLDRIFHNIFREQNPIFENKILSYFHRRMMLQYFRYRTDLNSDLRLLIFIFSVSVSCNMSRKRSLTHFKCGKANKIKTYLAYFIFGWRWHQVASSGISGVLARFRSRFYAEIMGASFQHS